MTPYTWRLCCLSLAVLFVVQASTGLVLRLAAPRIVRYAEAWSPVRGAAVALGLRWLPGALGLFVAGFLCVPVYLRLEPLASDEELGAACVLLACGAVLAYAIPLGRAAWWVWRSEIRLRALLRGADEQAGIFVIHETSPAMALAGLFHSRVVVSRQVLGLLSSDQMEAARRHERAHLESRDNWKRLLIEAAPIDFGGSALRQAWGRFSEWAADDRATEGDSARSVALASALVSVARLATLPGCLPQASMLVSDGTDFRIRVERLLAPTKPPLRTIAVGILAWLAGAFALAVAVCAQQPRAAAFLHNLLEALVD